METRSDIADPLESLEEKQPVQTQVVLCICKSNPMIA